MRKQIINSQAPLNFKTTSAHPLTRRGFLRASAAVSLAAAGAASLSACSEEEKPKELSATLKVSKAGPYTIIPNAETRAKNKGKDAYAETLQAWLDKNPGVKLEEINTDVWNKEAMVTSIAGRTGPAIFWANVIGGWSEEGIRQAFAQGMCADVTKLTKQHKLLDRMNPGVRSIWERGWVLGGKYFAAPATYTVGNGVHYRRDLIQQLGLPEPKQGWSWADLRALAKALTSDKRKGIMMQVWPQHHALRDAEGMNLLSKLPAPDKPWHWRYDFTLFADQYAKAAQNVRAMRFEDRSAIGDIGLKDDPWEPRRAFGRDETALHINTVNMITDNALAEDSPASLAQRLGKSFDEVVGWAPMPAGLSGHGKPSPGRGGIDGIGFSPDLSDAELDAAFDLHMYMIGEGLIHQKKAYYEKINDLRPVYGASTIVPVLKEIEGKLPGSAEEAWGPRLVAAVKAASELPPVPAEAWFIPSEENPGPGDQADIDTLTKWWYEAPNPDVPATLAKLSAIRNQDAAGFSSSVSKDDFAKAAAKYYKAHLEHWRQYSPEFASSTFEPWYEQHIKPVVGE